MNFVKFSLVEAIKSAIQKTVFIRLSPACKSNGRTVLISYIINPYIGYNSWHPNSIEVKAIVSCFRNLGFSVVLCDYRNVIVKNWQYDIRFGFGLALLPRKSCEKSKIIYYTTGLPSHIQNFNALNRLKEYRNKKIVDMKGEVSGIRLADSDATVLSCADFVLGIGDDLTTRFYSDCSSAKIKHFPAVIDCTSNEFSFFPKFDKEKINILWLGGKGAIHKGLDLIIEAISGCDNYFLHIAGPISKEEIFEDYSLSLKDLNFHYYGLIDTNVVDFSFCDIVILPSCSEGMATSVLTAIWKYGCYPIVSKYSGFNNLPKKYIVELDSLSIRDSLAYLKSERVDYSEARALNREWILKNCDIETFSSNLESYLIENNI